MSPQRLLRRDWWNTHWFAVGGAYVLIVLTVILVLGIRGKADRVTGVCKGQNEIRTTLRTLIVGSDKTLGKPGSAGYAYYKAHPEELAAAHRANHQTLVVFRPLKCD